MPAVPAILGAIGAGIGITGAGVTAGMSIAAGAAILGGATAAGIGIASSAAQASAAKKAAANTSQVAGKPDATQTVGDKTANSTSNASNLGRAALIATSPSGVSGLDPTGKRKLLGND